MGWRSLYFKSQPSQENIGSKGRSMQKMTEERARPAKNWPLLAQIAPLVSEDICDSPLQDAEMVCQ